MTKDEIIEMAVKAGNSYLFDAMQTDFLQRFAALVAEKERERLNAALTPLLEKINANVDILKRRFTKS